MTEVFVHLLEYINPSAAINWRRICDAKIHVTCCCGTFAGIQLCEVVKRLLCVGQDLVGMEIARVLYGEPHLERTKDNLRVKRKTRPVLKCSIKRDVLGELFAFGNFMRGCAAGCRLQH